jgi:hypothetical protein
LIGGSRGAEGALLIASYEPYLFSAVVANSPSWMINGPLAGIRVPVLLSDGGQDQMIQFIDVTGTARPVVVR